MLWLAAAALVWVMGGISLGQPRARGLSEPGADDLIESNERREDIRRRGIWFGLGIFLLLAGLASPDSLGLSHGGYLPQRLELLGLVALVVGLDLEVERTWRRRAGACLVMALVLQTLTVWDYALHSQRTAGQIMRAGDLVGTGQRIGTLLVKIRSPFRANPLIHADNWLGVGTGNILWSNYEAKFYYFPVQFRPEIACPEPRDFELVAVMTDPIPGEAARQKWERILAEHWASMDKILAWHGDPALDAITERWFEEAGRRGEIRVFTRRKPRDHGSRGSVIFTGSEQAGSAHRTVWTRHSMGGARQGIATLKPSSASSARRGKPRRARARSPWADHGRGGRPR